MTLNFEHAQRFNKMNIIEYFGIAEKMVRQPRVTHVCLMGTSETDTVMPSILLEGSLLG